MNLIRIDHVSLNLGDRPSAVAWYEDVLDVEVARRHASADSPVFAGPAGARLGLFADRAPGLRHIALATDDAGFEEVLGRLRERSVAHQIEHRPPSRSVYFADPDGNTLEVLTVAPEAGER